MTKQQVRLWVDPAFKRQIRRMAANEDISILELTRKIGREPINFEQFIKDSKRKNDEKLFF